MENKFKQTRGEFLAMLGAVIVSPLAAFVPSKEPIVSPDERFIPLDDPEAFVTLRECAPKEMVHIDQISGFNNEPQFISHDFGGPAYPATTPQFGYAEIIGLDKDGNTVRFETTDEALVGKLLERMDNQPRPKGIRV